MVRISFFHYQSVGPPLPAPGGDVNEDFPALTFADTR